MVADARGRRELLGAGARVDALVEEAANGKKVAGCKQKHAGWFDGKAVATSGAPIECNVSGATLFHNLRHGARYHVVVTATNGAGLTTRTASRPSTKTSLTWPSS